MRRLGRVQIIHGQLDVRENHSQHVVEVVGHAARQPADGFHLLGFTELFLKRGVLLFRLLALGDVHVGSGHPYWIAILVSY